MPQVYHQDQLLASSESTIQVEGNHYFPPDALIRAHFLPSDHHTVCGWKGRASYYHVRVGDEVIENAAWYYPDPKPDAAHIKDYVAFYKNKVQIK